MRSVCGAAVALCAVPSEGGLQNLSLLSANQAELGPGAAGHADAR